MTTTTAKPLTVLGSRRRYAPGTWRVRATAAGHTSTPGPVLRVVVVTGRPAPVTPVALPH